MPGVQRAEPSAWRRNLAVCIFGSFTTVLGMTVLIPFLPFYVEELGVHGHAAIVEWSGLIFAASFLASGLAAPLWGRFADRYGRRLILIRAALGMAVCIALAGCVQTIWQLLGVRLLTGLLGGYGSGATILVATATPKERSGWALGMLSSGIMAGGLVGPLVGGVLPEAIGIRATFLAVGGVIFIAFVATVLWVEEPRRDATRTTVSRPWAQVPDRRLVGGLLTTGALVTLATFSIEPIVTVYIARLAGPGAHVTLLAGLAMSATAFGAAVAAPRVGRLTDRHGARPVLIASLLATSLTLVVQALVTSGWQLVGLRLLMGVAVAGILPAVTGAIRHAIPSHVAGSILALNTSALAAGQVLGPLLGGFVGAHLGLRVVFAATALVTLAGAAMIGRLPRLDRSAGGP
ncbi:MFS family permease [Endobacter medicaginis]|uniref:MFS family permease n=1 Tax=Endobacter medicaginis TaxID=1181271 RepID=A0A839UWW0_9PROT|nr:MFS transporter [Endobacter medicaginis]MBB3172863.1 MFS family permease [Endobacter medicaginis]